MSVKTFNLAYNKISTQQVYLFIQVDSQPNIILDIIMKKYHKHVKYRVSLYEFVSIALAQLVPWFKTFFMNTV